jgi:hypothetical protein
MDSGQPLRGFRNDSLKFFNILLIRLMPTRRAADSPGISESRAA